MQPALDQLQKWDPENKDEVLSTYFRLSAPEGAPLTPGTLLVWPESAFPFPLTQDAGALAAIAELLPDGTALVTGAYREEYPPNGERQVYNTIYVIGDDGTILDAYDKVHLVPFGEYVPVQRVCCERLGLATIGPARVLPGSVPARAHTAVRPAVPPAHLLRDDLFGRRSSARGAAAGLPPERDERRLVRAHAPGLISTSIRRASAASRRASAGARRQHWHLGSHRRLRADASRGTRLGEATMIEARLPAAIAPPFYAQWRGLLFLLFLAVCLLAGCHKNSLPCVRRMIDLFICQRHRSIVLG